VAVAARQPLLVVGEDVHWADPSTLELLRLAIAQAPTMRMLMLLTCRLEFRLSWTAPVPLAERILDRLQRPQVEVMILHLTRDKPLPAEVVEQIAAKVDGVPLFVEELVKMVLESGLLQEQADRYIFTGSFPTLAIPTTLHDSLMARLDRLVSAKGVAQLGATIGRQFSYGLL
jgi:predicted ATPase